MNEIAGDSVGGFELRLLEELELLVEAPSPAVPPARRGGCRGRALRSSSSSWRSWSALRRLRSGPGG